MRVIVDLGQQEERAENNKELGNGRDVNGWQKVRDLQNLNQYAMRLATRPPSSLPKLEFGIILCSAAFSLFTP